MAGSNGSQTNDSGSQALVLLALGLLLLAILWVMWGDVLIYGLLELARMLMIPPRWVGHLLPGDYITTYNVVANYLNNPNSQAGTLNDVRQVYAFLGRTYYFVALPLVLAGAVILWRRPVALNYIGSMDLVALVKRNCRYYPQIRPAFIRKRSLLDEDPDQGPFARSLSYARFAEQYSLLLDDNGHHAPWRAWYADPDDPFTYDAPDTGDPTKPRTPLPWPAPALDGPATRHVFAGQLGPVWTDHSDLPKYHRALFGVLAARVARDTKAADAALFQMNSTWLERENGKHRMKCKLALTLADKHYDTLEMRHLYSQHGAYRNVLLSALLALAQSRSGICPTAMFIWLKVLDRPLFYAMNQVGRRVAWPEAAGVRSHIVAEQMQQRHLDHPVVEPAVRALAVHLISEGYLSTEQKISEATPD